MNKKVVLFGNEKLATGIEVQPVIQQSLRQAGYTIEATIIDRPAELPRFESELAVLAAYGRLLPESWLNRFPLGIINIHPSLLPIYRGPTPIEQAILDGADKTGVSIMKITAEMDAGPIYKQKSLRLNGDESKQELTDCLQKLGAELLLQALPGIFNGSLKPHQQPHVERDVSYTKKIVKDDGKVDWNQPAVHIERQIRAYSGWPGSFTTLKGYQLIVTAAQAVATSHRDVKPGDIEVSAGLIMVGCGQGYLCIERLKPAGKREMSAQEFLAGHTLA